MKKWNAEINDVEKKKNDLRRKSIWVESNHMKESECTQSGDKRMARGD